MSLKKIKSTLSKAQQEAILHKLHNKQYFTPKKGRATNAHLLSTKKLKTLKNDLLETIAFIESNVDKYVDRGVEALTIAKKLLTEIEQELKERNN